ncbi:hypothetical protein ACOSP7_006849 [Xanthoceras sorbifolium]
MIFAPLIGVNHHRQSIVLACAFLSDETIDSFLCAPKMIITDQVPAMTKVIAQVFPNTYHSFCIWHILNKLHENGWFQSLYEIRSKWVPVFVNHIFSAGMSSSQRYISKKYSLMDFILRFNRVLTHQCHKELITDHTNSNGKLVLKSQWSRRIK